MSSSATNIMSSVTVFPLCFVRTPLLPFNHVAKLLDDPSHMHDLLQVPKIREAIYNASPELFAGLERDPKIEGERLRTSLFKYLIRMSSRCTPFGIMAGVSIAPISNSVSINPNGEPKERLHRRLDMKVVMTIADQINNAAERLSHRFYPNNTIYRIGEVYRYVELIHVDNNRSYTLSAVPVTEELSIILAKAETRITGLELVSMVCNMGYTEEESIQFITELIDSSILLSEFHEHITGEEFSESLRRRVKKYSHLNDISKLLDLASERLEGCDNAKIDPIVEYRKMEKEFDKAKVPVYAAEFIQIDSIKQRNDVIDKAVIEELQKTLTFLGKLGFRYNHSGLKKFREAFFERYEYQEIPLMEALDVEHGLGYPLDSLIRSTDNFIGNLNLPQRKTSHELTTWPVTGWDRFMLEKYRIALSQGAEEIVLEESDPLIKYFLDNSKTAKIDSPPSSFFSTINYFKEGDDFSIALGITSGPSCANLLGRFCHGEPVLSQAVQEMILKEEKTNPEVIFAEIVHLPQSRVGNILARPKLRAFEIPIVTTTSTNDGFVIPLTDLLIYVRGEKIYLKSKRLNKVVIPRMTTAHNFTNNSIPHYHFLCDLISQESSLNLNFSWGLLKENAFLPRLRFGKTILSRRTWVISDKHITLSKEERTADLQRIQEYLIKTRICDHVVLIDNDNELALNLCHKGCLEILYAELKKGLPVILKENLFSVKESGIKDFCNEIIISFFNNNSSKKISLGSVISGEVTRTFYPTSNWVYLKIYCGENSGDEILVTIIKGMVESFLTNGTMKKWFFIRYADPHPHLRIRFEFVSIPGEQENVIFREACSRLQSSDLVERVSFDTYVRELERYGEYNIEHAESLFRAHSDFTLSVLSELQNHSTPTDVLRWMIALRGINSLFLAFKYDQKQALPLLMDLSAGFIKEFQLNDESVSKILNDKFRTERHIIDQAFKNEATDLLSGSFHSLLAVKETYDRNAFKSIEELMGQNKLNVEKNSLLVDYCHMFLNRIFTDNQRIKELMTYELLRRYYRSEIGKGKSHNGKSAINVT